MFELVERFEDHTELVRHTGSRAVCETMANEFRACGFRVFVRSAGDTARQKAEAEKRRAVSR